MPEDTPRIEFDWDKYRSELGDRLYLEVKTRAKSFANANKGLAEFAQERARRLAELGIQLLQAPEGDARERVKTSIRFTQQTLMNLAATAGLNTKKATFGAVRDILVGLGNELIKNAPAMIEGLMKRN